MKRTILHTSEKYQGDWGLNPSKYLHFEIRMSGGPFLWYSLWNCKCENVPNWSPVCMGQRREVIEQGCIMHYNCTGCIYFTFLQCAFLYPHGPKTQCDFTAGCHHREAGLNQCVGPAIERMHNNFSQVCILVSTWSNRLYSRVSEKQVWTSWATCWLQLGPLSTVSAWVGNGTGFKSTQCPPNEWIKRNRGK